MSFACRNLLRAIVPAVAMTGLMGAEEAVAQPPRGLPLPIETVPGQRLEDFDLRFTATSPDISQTTPYHNQFKEAPGNGGYLYAATLPYGLVRCAPILVPTAKDAQGKRGLASLGVTHLEVSGTGGSPQYGNYRFMLLPGDGGIPERKTPQPVISHSGDSGSEFITVFADPAVTWTTTVGHAAAVHRLEPRGAGRFSIALDLGLCWSGIAGLKTQGEQQQHLGASYAWISDTEVEATQRIMGGWGYGGEYQVHARIRFSKPPVAMSGWAADKVLKPGLRSVEDVLQRQTRPIPGRTGLTRWVRPDPSTPVGFVATFDAVVDMSVGISFTSRKRAAEFLDRDTAGGFAAVRDRAKAAWRTTFSHIIVEGATQHEREVLYTQWRACQLLPSDRSGDNPLWQGDAPFYDDFYCLWDTFHVLNPLLTLVVPRRAGHLANGLVDMAEHEGWFFDARMGNTPGRSQAGCGGELVAAEAALKRLPYVDPARTLKMAVRSATTVSDNPSALGRWDVENYWSKGYVQSGLGGGSRTIEYSRADWTIAQLAKSLGDSATAEKFAKSANNWENLWNDEISDGHFKGFVWGREPDGGWLTKRNGKPATVWNTAGTGNAPFCENFTNIYSLNVIHDADRLAARCGGPQQVMDRLALLNVRYLDPADYAGLLADRGKLIERSELADGNEPDYDPIWLFHLYGRPDLTATYMRTLNLHGGDDAGAGNARLVALWLGVFPCAGSDVYFLVAPHFPRALIQRDDGTTLEILAPGATGSKLRKKLGSGAKLYIASAMLNGKPLDRAWIRHSEIAKGGKLEFTLSDTPTQWGIGKLPPCRGRTVE